MKQKTKELLKKIIPSLFYPFISKYYNKKVSKNLIILAKKEIKKNFEINNLFPENKIIDMIKLIRLDRLDGHINIQEKERDIFIYQLRFYRLYKFFKKNYPDMLKDKIIDVGDASGLMLKALGKKGLAVNIDRKTVEYIKKQGIKTEIGDVENLKYKDKSFDYSFCFQTIEHVKNPVKALSELSRITKKRIFVSIPYKNHTIILPSEAPDHIFEFSTEDFIKIARLAGLSCVNNFPINYFEPIGSKENKGSYFNFFILELK